MKLIGQDYLKSLKTSRTLEKCEEKLQQELDIINILNKIRESSSIFNHLLTKR
jgi:hypothetical protein